MSAALTPLSCTMGTAALVPLCCMSQAPQQEQLSCKLPLQPRGSCVVYVVYFWQSPGGWVQKPCGFRRPAESCCAGAVACRLSCKTASCCLAAGGSLVPDGGSLYSWNWMLNPDPAAEHSCAGSCHLDLPVCALMHTMHTGQHCALQGTWSSCSLPLS